MESDSEAASEIERREETTEGRGSREKRCTAA